MLNLDVAKAFAYFILTREEARKNKEFGKSPPWCDDTIINNNHFCNVRRQDDRGTKEIQRELRKVPTERLPHSYTMARLFNMAHTVEIWLHEDGGAPAVKEYRDRGYKIFHTAYVVTTCGVSMDKVDYVQRVVEDVYQLKVPNHSCRSAFDALRTVDGLGSFLAGQVVADLKNDRYLVGAEDWHSFSVMGPGSKKGLDFIFTEGGTNEGNYEYRISLLESIMPPEVVAMKIHRQDLQNCLCEFSKYVKYSVGLPGRSRPYTQIQRKMS